MPARVMGSCDGACTKGSDTKEKTDANTWLVPSSSTNTQPTSTTVTSDARAAGSILTPGFLTATAEDDGLAAASSASTRYSLAADSKDPSAPCSSSLCSGAAAGNGIGAYLVVMVLTAILVSVVW